MGFVQSLNLSGLTMTRIEKLFWLSSRLTLVALFLPQFQNNLFAPFLSVASENLLDPWSAWLNSDGRSDAFPYGPFMYAALIVITLFFKITFSWLDQIDPIFFTSSVLSLVLLTIDFISTRYLLLAVDRKALIRAVICLGPLPLYVSYIHGQNDLIPGYIVLLLAVQIMNGNWNLVGVALGIGISAKFSLLLAIPFLLVYFINSGQFRRLRSFSITFFPIAMVTLLPLIWSHGYKEMVIQSPEFVKSLDFSISLGSIQVFLLPVGYLALLLSFWSLSHISPKVLVSYLAFGFFAVASLQTRSVGWYLWGYLILLIFIARIRSRLIILFAAWQVLVVLLFVYRSGNIDFRVLADVSWKTNAMVLSLLFTITLVTSFVLLFKLISETNSMLDPFGLRHRPMTIAIAGDSGVGKDTVSKALGEIINENPISFLLGDDYHLGERKSLLWKNKTHLNTSANDLPRWNRDVRLSVQRKSVEVRHYDHSNGMFTDLRTISPGDFVILNGLHSLLLPEVSHFDLSVYLEMDEALRIKFKVDRDSKQRSQVDKHKIRQNITKRLPDSSKFITVQADVADLCVETRLKVISKLSTIEYRVKAKDEALLIDIYSFLQTFEPQIAIMVISSNGDSTLIVKPELYTEEFNERFLRGLIPNIDDLVINPSFKLQPGSLIAAIVLIAATKKREFANVV